MRPIDTPSPERIDAVDACAITRTELARRRHEPAAHTVPRRHMHLPFLLTSGETAALLRTTTKAVYAMIGRGQLPGVTRLGRRVLIRRDELLDWLDQKRTPSPKEQRR